QTLLSIGNSSIRNVHPTFRSECLRSTGRADRAVMNLRRRFHKISELLRGAKPRLLPQPCSAFLAFCFLRKSSIALLIASSASTEQWIFTGGKLSSEAIWELVSFSASSTRLPLIHSVASDEEAIAEPHPNVLKRASSITPSGFTLI